MQGGCAGLWLVHEGRDRRLQSYDSVSHSLISIKENNVLHLPTCSGSSLQVHSYFGLMQSASEVIGCILLEVGGI